MNISDIMTQDVEVISPDASLQQAAQQMQRLDVGALPVCTGDRLVGMLTDRDIIVRAVAEGHDSRDTRVRDVMTDEMHYCFEDQDVEEAVRIMNEYQIRRLPILNRSKRLVGIVSLGDVAVRVGDDALAGEALEGVSERDDR